MTNTQIRKWNRSDEYYDMSKLGMTAICRLEDDAYTSDNELQIEKLSLLHAECRGLMKQCEELRDSETTNIDAFMSAQDNADDTVMEKMFEEGSVSYYGCLIGSYVELTECNP